MKRSDEMIQEALLAREPPIERDEFCERVLSRLPRARRRFEGSVARRLSLVAGAAIGSVVTLLLGAPIDGLFADHLEYGELMSPLLGASIVLGALVIPLVWLVLMEQGDG